MIHLDLPDHLNHLNYNLAKNFDPLLKEKANFKYQVSVKLVNTKQIQKINKEYRNKNQPTDILSFPLFHTILELPNHQTIIGDLVICETIIKDKDLTLKEVLIHGILHLLGYDHEHHPKEWKQAVNKVNYESKKTKK